MPPGIIASGIFEVTPGDEANCCWIAGTATFPVHVAAGANQLRVTVALPDFPTYHPRPQTMTVSVDGVRRGRYANLDPGTHTVNVPLRQSNSARDAVVKLVMAYTFVPKTERISDDSRRIAIQLKSVAVR